MIKNKENEAFHVVRKDGDIIHYSFVDLEHLIKVDLNRDDRKLQSYALENSIAKKTSYSIELLNLLKLVLDDELIRIYQHDDHNQLFNDYINVDKELITEFLEANNYCSKTLQLLLDDNIDNEYLTKNPLESVVDSVLSSYSLKCIGSNEDIFNEIHEQLQSHDEFELALINYSENHSFYKTIEIPIKNYIGEQLKHLKTKEIKMNQDH